MSFEMAMADEFPKEKLHQLIDLVAGLDGQERAELLKGLDRELQEQVRVRLRPPIDWNTVLGRIFDTVDRYLDTRGIS